MESRMDILKDLPECFARFGSSDKCNSCDLKPLCMRARAVYKLELGRFCDQLLEKVAELERVNRKIEAILGGISFERGEKMGRI